MAGIENQIFNVLRNEGEYEAYRQYVPDAVLSPVGRNFIKYIDQYWEDYAGSDQIHWDDFSVWLRFHAAPSDKHLEAMEQLCETNKHTEVEETGRDVLDSLVRKDIAEQIQSDLDSTSFDVSDIETKLDKLKKFINSDLESDSLEVSTDIEDVLEHSKVLEAGFEFSLPTLQEAVGPVRSGDTIYVPARPEVGKTTFLVHQAGHMITQTEDTSAIIFSNEEDGNRVMLRLYQAVLNMRTRDILDDPAMARAEYKSTLGDMDRIKVVHSSSLHKKDCEQAIQQNNPDLIVFNMLSKIKGFGSNQYANDVDIFTNQGIWMREIANAYGCASMTAWQAGGQAHGKAWVESDDMYGSKTGIVAEADVILGIGKVIDTSVPENHRYLHLSKNKLPGDAKTDENKRHGYFDDIYIDTERGRFYE